MSWPPGYAARTYRINLSYHCNLFSASFTVGQFYGSMALVSSPFIPYHQFLTRPVKGSICSFEKSSSKPQQRPIRETLAIKHSAVHDLSFLLLWIEIFQSLDGFPHDIAHCDCCRGKEIYSDDGRNFVLVICGDLRERSPGNRSWP